MAYDKETIKHLADSLGLSVKDFETQFKDEKEIKVELPTQPFKQFKSEDDFNTYTKNIKAPEYGRGVDDGKKNSVEVFIKKLRDSEGLDLTGSQLDGNHLVKSLKEKYSGDNKALLAQFDKDKSILLQKSTDLENEYTAKFKDQSNRIVKMKLRGDSLEGVKGETKFDKIDAVDLIMKDISVEKDAAGREFINYKGVPQKNENLEPLAMNEITDNIFIEKKWYKDDKGRGGGNEGGSGGATNTYKAFLEEMETKGVHQGSATFQDELNSRLEDKDFKESVSKSE